MKRFKRILLPVICAAMLVLTGCQKDQQEEYPGQILDVRPAEVLQMLEEKQSFVLVVGNDGCTSCVEFKELLGKIIDHYHMTFYFMENNKEEERQTVDNLKYNYLYRLEWLPSVYIIQEGKSVDMKEAPNDYSELVDWLKSYEYLDH